MLAIVPLTPAHADALIADDGTFELQFGWTVVSGFLDFPEALPAIRTSLADDAPDRWGSHLFVDGEANEVVGFGGFKGAPHDGSVEIGYSVAPSRRRRGHARAATQLMIEQADQAGVRTVVAHTLAEPNPSNALLSAMGFARTDEILDPDDGMIWRWELPLPTGG